MRPEAPAGSGSVPFALEVGHVLRHAGITVGGRGCATPLLSGVWNLRQNKDVQSMWASSKRVVLCMGMVPGWAPFEPPRREEDTAAWEGF